MTRSRLGGSLKDLRGSASFLKELDGRRACPFACGFILSGRLRPSFLQGFKSRGHSAADTAADATAGLIEAGARWGHHAPACAEAEAKCPWRKAKGPSSAQRKGGEGPGRHPGRDPAGSSPRSTGSASQREWPVCVQGQRPGGRPGRRRPPAEGQAWHASCSTSTWARP